MEKPKDKIALYCAKNNIHKSVTDTAVKYAKSSLLALGMEKFDADTKTIEVEPSQEE